MMRLQMLLIILFPICLLGLPVCAATTTHTYYFAQPRVEIINGQATVILEGSPTWGRVGEPLLPQSPVQLLLPPGEEAVSISVETADPVLLGDGYLLSHRQQPYPLSLGSPPEPTPRNEQIYTQNDPYPAYPAGDLQTQFLCGHGIAYAAAYPVVYRPASGELAYYPWITVTIETQPTLRSQVSFTQMLKRSADVQNRLQQTVHNTSMIQAYGPEAQTDTDDWDLLLITMEQFIDDFQEYVDFKNCSGIRTTVETVENIYLNYPGMDNQEKIRNCIIDYYQTYDLKYVFIGGDDDQVPDRPLYSTASTYSAYLPGDLYYAGLDGSWNNDGDDRWGEPGEDDLVAEVYVGRSCGDNDIEIANVTRKHFFYQAAPIVDEVASALMTGENLGWPIWAWEYKEEIRLGSSTWGYTTVPIPANVTVDTLYERPGHYWSAMGDLLPLLNEGTNLVNHLGHASETYVMQFNMGSINDNNFTNNGINHNFFIAYSQGCDAGAFDYSDCILEAFTTIAHAAVAFVGNSRYGWGDNTTTNGCSQHYDRQFFDAIFGENITRIGATNQDSKEDNIWMLPGDDVMRWCYYELNLFGDPTLDIWTALPGEFQPNYSSFTTVGTQTFTVSNISVRGALVTLSRDNQVLGQGEADASGIAVVVLDDILMETGELDLYITAHDMVPYHGTIDVISPDGPFVVFSAYVIEDEITGNANGQWDYSEEIELTLDVENVGMAAATNINLTVGTAEPSVTLTDSTEFLGDLGVGEIRTVENGFVMELSPEVEDQLSIEFSLIATDGDSTWISSFWILSHAPAVSIDTLLICNTGGNYDDMFEPGETGTFEFDIVNSGSCNAPDVNFELNCDHPLITITENVQTCPLLSAGEMLDLDFHDIAVDIDFPNGDTAYFALNIEAGGGYVNLQQFFTIIGDQRWNPMGPDEYGYYAYDKYDGLGSPQFEWAEISPRIGGSGTDLQLGEDDAVTVDLPFNFQYYGEVFNRATICSDGWLAFGEVGQYAPFNRSIPESSLPNNTIAAFWDELTPAAAGLVCTYHDAASSRFIVEWYLVVHEGFINEYESFQIILYDPAVYTTPTGDGDVVMQYELLSDMIDGCTIGIENGAGDVGLQYLYCNEYNPLSMPLENGLAIKFTTIDDFTPVESAEVYQIPPDFALAPNYPNPFNPVTSISFALPKAEHVKLSVYNIQGQSIFELVNGFRPAGYHEVTFNASQLASGMYFYQIDAGEFRVVRKMVLMK